MKNDNIQANHRGSSPPFQDPEHDFYDWMKGLQSFGEGNEKRSPIQTTRRPGNDRTKPINSIDGGPRQVKDDEARWQDDGGMGGEAV